MVFHSKYNLFARKKRKNLVKGNKTKTEKIKTFNEVFSK
jgi:hypothetical protein